MMMPTFSILAALIVGSPPDKPVQPNIVVILSDDLGPGDIGGGVARTPNLDRMAREGTRFNRYYSAAPVCSPSRCGLLTGQFPARWKITTFLQTREGNRKAEQVDFLDAKAPSLPRALKAAGYATAHVGKWHLGGGRDVVNPPKFAAYGYDVGFGTWESPEPHPDITTDNEWIWSDRDPVKRWERTRWMTDRTLDFLKSHPDQPCFVNLWLDDPHTPWVPSIDDQTLNARGKATGKGDTPARLKGVLVEMDRQIGRLLDAIRESKADRPTIVLFLSDNGPLPPFPEQKRTGGLRGSKLSLFEGGLRLPFFAWSPGLIPAGRTEEAVLAAVDLFPTLCRLADAPLPEGYISDGEDMSPAFLGKPAPTRSRPLFWEFGRNAEGFNYPGAKNNRSPNLAILDGRWKLLINADGTHRELYDITKDERETANLESEQPDEAKRLSEALLQWRKSMP